MGNYTNAEDLKRLYPVDRSGLVDKDFDFFIKMIEAEIDGIIGVRYTVPVSPAPVQLRDCASEGSVIKLLERFYTSDNSEGNKQLEVRREVWLAKLKSIADGDTILTTSSGAVIAQDSTLSGISSDTSGYTPTFGHGFPGGEEVDPDRLDDERDARD